MELTPYSLADNTLRILFRGLQEPIFFGVKSETASQVLETLFSMDEQGDYPIYVQFRLLNGGRVLLSTEHIILLHHLFDYGMPSDRPPPPQRYGDIVSEDVAEEHEWVQPGAVIGIEGVGVMVLYDQNRQSLGSLGDSVKEGFFIGPFLEFTDDDGETTLVSSEHVAFVLVDHELLPA